MIDLSSIDFTDPEDGEELFDEVKDRDDEAEALADRREAEQADREYNFNHPRRGERWCRADFEYDPLSRKGFE